MGRSMRCRRNLIFKQKMRRVPGRGRDASSGKHINVFRITLNPITTQNGVVCSCKKSILRQNACVAAGEGLTVNCLRVSLRHRRSFRHCHRSVEHDDPLSTSRGPFHGPRFFYNLLGEAHLDNLHSLPAMQIADIKAWAHWLKRLWMR